MRHLLFLSIFIAFASNRAFHPYATFIGEARGIKYIWKVNAAQLLLDLVDDEDRDKLEFQQALKEAVQMQKSTTKNLVSLFGQAYSKQSKQALSALFSANKQLGIKANFSNEAVLEILQKEVDKLIEQHIIIIQNRVKMLGAYVTTVAPIENTDQFAIDIQNANDQTQEYIEIIGKLEFWELHQDLSIFEHLIKLNDSLKTEEEIDKNPLFDLLNPNIPYYSHQISANLGYAKHSDVASITNLLSDSTAKRIFGSKFDSIRFVWDANSFENEDGEEVFTLYALNTQKQETSALNRSHITSSAVTPSPYGDGFYISLDMNPAGTLIWKKMTTANVRKQIAIVLDNKVYSAPMVNEPIPNGHVSISGGFETLEIANYFSNILSLKNVLPSSLTLIKKEVYSN
jgi:SecD/SecF fusion protein